jgi:NCS1 family nucleobase:cation symporter-1
MGFAAGSGDRQVVEDTPWSVEGHDIEPIPDSDRHGFPVDLFGMWIGPNINYVVLLTGALAITKGLSVWGAISAVVVGNALGCAVLGMSSIMGPRTGSAAIVTSRTSFGQLAANLPILASTLSGLGWFSINSVVATQSLEQLLHLAGLPGNAVVSWTALLAVLCAETLLAIYGHATIIAAEKSVSILLAALFAGLLIILIPQIDPLHPLHPMASGASSIGTWSVVMGLAFSYPISWANFASDYSRYLPKRTRWQSIALYSGGGQFVALVFCELIGVCFAMAVKGDLSDPVADLPKVLPTWYIAPLLFAVIAGGVAANVPTGYTAGLGLLALRIPVRRVTALLIISLVTLLVRIATLLSGHFFDLYQQWLGYTIVWTCPWVAIVVVDYFLRGQEYNAADLMRWGTGQYWYRHGINWNGTISFAVGLAASFLFSNSDMYASPLMTRYLGGVDLSFEAGLLVSGLLYFALWQMGNGRAGGERLPPEHPSVDASLRPGVCETVEPSPPSGRSFVAR